MLKRDIESFAIDTRIDIQNYLEAKVFPKLKRLWSKVKRVDPSLSFFWLEGALFLNRGKKLVDLGLTIKIQQAQYKLNAVARRRPALVKLVQLLELIRDELHRQLTVEEINA